MKEAMASAVEVVNAVESSINLLLPKVSNGCYIHMIYLLVVTGNGYKK